MEDTPFPCGNRKPQGRGLSSVSLTADSFLCGGSLFGGLHTKPPLKGEVPALGGRRGSVLHAACPRRLCQPPWTQPSLSKPRPTHRRNQLSRNVPRPTPAALREGARGRGFSQRSRLPRSSSPPRLFGWEREGGDFSVKSPLPRNPSQIHSRVDFPDVAAFDGAELPAGLHQGRNGNNAFEHAADTLAGVAAGHIVWIGRDDD